MNLSELRSTVEKKGRYLSRMLNPTEGSKMPVLMLLLGLMTVGFIWVLRPWFQPFWYQLRFKLVGMILYLVLSTVVFIVGSYSDNTSVTGVLYLVGSILLVIALISPVVSGIYTSQALSDEVTSSSTPIQSVSNAPSVEDRNIRIMTIQGAETQAKTSFNQPTHRLTDGELVKRNGDLSTSYAAVPEGLYKSVTKKQEGAIFVTINSEEPEVKRIDTEFEQGRGMLIFDDIHFQIQKDNMNTILVNPTTFQTSNGKMYNMYTGVQHELRFGISKGIPMVYPVPEYSGVYLADTDGSVDYLAPDEATTDSRVDGESMQQFYPYDLLRKEVISTNMRYGWINTVTNQRGMKEYPDTPSIDNKPPYTMIFDDGSYGQVLTMEAINQGTGVFEVYIANGRTGEKEKLTFDSPRKGPGYAVDKTITNDAEKYGQGKLAVSEVYPIFRNGELWYQVNSVQSETGIYAYTAFYNSEEGELIKAFNDKQVNQFYSGSNDSYKKDDKTIDTPQENTREVENPSVWVVITDESETNPYTIPVDSDETVSVTQTEPNENESDENSGKNNSSG